MVRIKQFADDLGIPYNEAKKLVMACLLYTSDAADE